MVWFCWKKGNLKLRLNYSFIFVFFVLYLLLLNLIPIVSLEISPYSNLVARTAELDDVRKNLWENLYYAVVKGPWWGYGWNQVGLAQALTADSVSGVTIKRLAVNSHNIFLDLLIWNGPIIGSVLIIV